MSVLMPKSEQGESSLKICMPTEVDRSIILYIIKKSAYNLLHDPQLWKQMVMDLEIGWIVMKKYFDTYISPKLCEKKSPFTFLSTEHLKLLVKGLLSQKDLESENSENVTEVARKSASNSPLITPDLPQRLVKEQHTPNVQDIDTAEEPECSLGTNRVDSGDGINGTQHSTFLTAPNLSTDQSSVRTCEDNSCEITAIEVLSHDATEGALTPNQLTRETEQPRSSCEIDGNDSEGTSEEFISNTDQMQYGDDTCSLDVLVGTEREHYMEGSVQDDPQVEIEDGSLDFFDQHAQAWSSPERISNKSCADRANRSSLSDSLFADTTLATLDESDCIIVTSQADVVIELLDDTPPEITNCEETVPLWIRCLVCENRLNITNHVSNSNLREAFINCSSCDNEFKITSQGGRILDIFINKKIDPT